MRSSLTLLSIVFLSSLSLSSHALPEPTVDATEPVRGYFAAIEHQDFSRMMALTDGDAQRRTSTMVSQLTREAAQHHARIELKVRRLAVQQPGALQPGRGVPVPVSFHIDVIGHKWLLHRVARVLEGDARFYVDPQKQDRIVSIEGSLL